MLANKYSFISKSLVFLSFCEFFLKSIFFACLQIREYHRRNPSARLVSTTDDFEELLKEEPVIEFTGEVLSPFLFVACNSARYFVCLFIMSHMKFNLSNLLLACIFPDD